MLKADSTYWTCLRVAIGRDNDSRHCVFTSPQRQQGAGEKSRLRAILADSALWRIMRPHIMMVNYGSH
ncbi:MAG TPA: hypothetical protein DCG12_10870 [Planctomycetaceae bacterium]|nr:hypothetical protein [Planctomycetaceae bacterium]